MKTVYKNFILKYPQVANKELEELCNIFQKEVGGTTLHQVKLGSKSREAVYELSQDFTLRVFYQGKKEDVFCVSLYYKNDNITDIQKIQAKHVFYRIENIKIAIEYTLKKRKSDLDFYLPLYKKLADILIDLREYRWNNKLEYWDAEEVRVFELKENEDLLLKGLVSKKITKYYHQQKTSYEVNGALLHDILFKELKKFISFCKLKDKVEEHESLIENSQQQIHELVNNFN